MRDVVLLWDVYWPVIVIALLIGTAGGLLLFRPRPKRTRWLGFAALALAVLGVTALWHGPFGAAAGFRGAVEQVARSALVNYEMTQVEARLERDPLTRRLILSGPADEFQRGELVRIMNVVPGVGAVRWADGERGGFALPLLALAELLALAGFGLGLALAYLIELRRRARAEWRW